MKKHNRRVRPSCYREQKRTREHYISVSEGDFFLLERSRFCCNPLQRKCSFRIVFPELSDNGVASDFAIENNCCCIANKLQVNLREDEASISDRYSDCALRRRIKSCL